MDTVPINYNLTFEPDLKKFIFTGTEIITASCKKPTNQIIMHCAELKIKSCIVQSGNTVISSTPKTNEKKEELSNFACLALDVAAAHLVHQYAMRGAFKLQNLEDPLSNCGLVIIGMGKLGARELNYSSDIDLIILYDTNRIKTLDPHLLQTNFVRLTRDLITLMHERTPDGYVFRTDLRLRPDPGSTPIAMSVIAAETYYESLGQNWERAAMIKARALAGDIEAGNEFLQHLIPFVWRKNLDFAAIQDIHSIKRQINAREGGSDIQTHGHNIKLGQGGIREIEFFAQTQQLIWGGRQPNLRTPTTVRALSDLAAFGQCEEKTATELTESYEFLRRVEHRQLVLRRGERYVVAPVHQGPRHPALAHPLQLPKPLNGSGKGPGASIQHAEGIEYVYLELVGQWQQVVQQLRIRSLVHRQAVRQPVPDSFVLPESPGRGWDNAFVGCRVGIDHPSRVPLGIPLREPIRSAEWFCDRRSPKDAESVV